jgi:hypothetical protein
MPPAARSDGGFLWSINPVVGFTLELVAYCERRAATPLRECIRSSRGITAETHENRNRGA